MPPSPPAPAVSVVVPLYNKKATVERTLASILGQTFGDFEILVVDDGSSDGGPELIESEIADPRVKVFRQANAGPGAARNRGLAEARGTLVTFLDADDEWRPELLERAVEHLAAHPECAAFTSAFFTEPAGEDRWLALRPFGFEEGVWRLTPDTPQAHLKHVADAFHPTTAVYRTEAVRKFGGFFERRCTFGEDVYLWIQILLNHPIYRHMTPLAHYHMEDSQLGIGGRRGPLPIEPVLEFPDPIRAACPEAMRRTLELWLGYQAIRAAFMQLDRGDPAAAPQVLARFPGAAAWGARYLQARARIAFPALYATARAAKRLLGRVAKPVPGA
jgi:glycosyltransferase involved in cell wall biosynthesis